MALTLLHFVGLNPGQTSWFSNSRGGQVDVYPGEWVRLDLSVHAEVLPALEKGVAIIADEPAPEANVLDDQTDANRPEVNRLAYQRDLRARARSAGDQRVLALSESELETAASRFRPWPGWEDYLPADVVDARSDRRGPEPRVGLPSIFDKNFPVLYRLAGLKARQAIEDHRKAIALKVESCWASGEYESKADLRRLIQGRHPSKNKAELMAKQLWDWKAWDEFRLPSTRTLLRYRSMLGAEIPVRKYIDDQILDVLTNPCQRIILGPIFLRAGPYEPNKAAAILTAIGPSVGCAVLDIKPAHDLAVGASSSA